MRASIGALVDAARTLSGQPDRAAGEGADAVDETPPLDTARLQRQTEALFGPKVNGPSYMAPTM